MIQAANETTSNANTGEGFAALQSVTTGSNNTALGAGALFSLTTGVQNTATGAQALHLNTADRNTADGFQALVRNTTSFDNTATGWRALFSNIDGGDNTANGSGALYRNTNGSNNTANGFRALISNTTGSNNTANGESALLSNTMGGSNTAIGDEALFGNTTGSSNIALGIDAGNQLTTGDNNIDIGNPGVADEASTIRIGTGQTATFIAGINGVNQGTGTAVFINTTTGQLGTAAPSSSRRFKKEIKRMDQASEAILGLKPVSFQYKSDTTGTPQFGLIAEEVAEVNPDLVVRDDKGEIYTVRYEAVNAMLLNEFLKEHRKVRQQDATIADLKSTVAEQQKQIKALASGLQKVSDQLETSKPAAQTVVNN